MTANVSGRLHLNAPDPDVLARLRLIELASLPLALLIAAVVLLAWLVPSVGTALPEGWSLMKANTALAVLLCGAAQALQGRQAPPGQAVSHRHRWRSGAVALSTLLPAVLASSALLQHGTGLPVPLQTLFAADAGSPRPGLMSIQTAMFVLLLCATRLAQLGQRPALRWLLEALIFAAVFFVLILVAGHAFSAVRLFGQSSSTLLSLQTLTCLSLLSLAQLARHLPRGAFAAITDTSLGSAIVRSMLPVCIFLPLLAMLKAGTLASNDFPSLPYVAALAAAVITAIALPALYLLARKINRIEDDLRSSATVDSLTGLHNYRGFHLLGEQALRHSIRTAEPLTVLFFDVDGLKQVNDGAGHDVGSALLVDVATLLLRSFRASDAIGRLGGDEFAVAAHGSPADLDPTLRRLKQATDELNSHGKRPYQVSFSSGVACRESTATSSFADLVASADAAMYLNKRQRRAERDEQATRRLNRRPDPSHIRIIN